MSGSIVAFRTPALHASPAEAGIGARLRQLAEAALREWRLHRDMRRLEELDGAALHDIGLTRGGIEGAVRHGRSRRAPASPVFELPPTRERHVMAPSWTEWR